jgi:preprotein translocase subunit SecD
MGDNVVSDGAPIDTAVTPPLLADGVAGAAVGTDQTGQPTLDLTFQPASTKLIERWTTDHVGEVLAVAFDGTVVAAPFVMEPIRDGQLQISSGGVGGFGAAEAERLVAILRSGAYPVPVREAGTGEGP